MKSDNLRITHQREVILEELRSVKSHPCADELYGQIKQRMPRISLATVYRNLEILADQGLVQKIEVGGRQKRFDGNPEGHYHIRCILCDKVDDLQMKPINNLADKISNKCGYKVLGHRLEFIGVCGECSNKTTATKSITGCVISKR